MNRPSQERRKYPRVEKSVPLKVRGKEFDVVTETRNLSCAGAYCRVNKYFEPMTKVEIHLLLPFKKGEKVTTKKVTCRGVVVRVESQPGDDYFNIAIFFNEIQKKDIKAISEFVNSTAS